MIGVAIVDDDFRVAAIHAAYVQQVSGFTVVGTAHSAAAAVDLVDQLQPDLLLLDLYLPDEHGLSLLHRLRQGDHPAVDVIVITAAKDVDTVRTAMRFGSLHYLIKPFPFEALRDKLRSYARMRSQLATSPEADQAQVDRVFSALSTAGPAHPPKGQTTHTLDTVARLVAASDTGLTALQVAEASGVSRATAQRYLSSLATAGRVTVHLRYGTAGRPEHIYRWAPGQR